MLSSLLLRAPEIHAAIAVSLAFIGMTLERVPRRRGDLHAVHSMGEDSDVQYQGYLARFQDDETMLVVSRDC